MPADGRLQQSIEQVVSHRIFQNAPAHFARCGPVTLRLLFASERLADLFLPAFLATKDRETDLTVVFAGAEDIDLSHLVPSPADRPRISTSDIEYAVWQTGPKDVLSMLDFQSKQAFVWLPQNTPPAWYASRPALPLVHAITRETPWTGVHGGCVGLNGRCLLLAGKGKSGKTTASLACARAGWDYAGDDFVFADSETGNMEPLFATARLRTGGMNEFSALLHTSVELSHDDDDARHELRLADVFGREKIKGGKLAAILLPRRQGAAEPEFSPARRSEAFSALLPNTSVGLLGWPEKTARKVATLAERAPAFFVDTADRPDYITDAFRRFLDRV
jgi:hypothetical protein